MSLPIAQPFAPMEALLVDDIPRGEAWLYEPKWDGFRCLAFRDGDAIELQSKSGQPLTRYFPEVVERLRALPEQRFVVDGELLVPVEGQPSFDALLQRIHPAASRVHKLAHETPALYVLFDLLVDTNGKQLTERNLGVRRESLEDWSGRNLKSAKDIRLSPTTHDRAQAEAWLRGAGGALDGVVAKRTDLDYRSGERTGMQKVKRLRTADCVIGGFRYASKGGVVGSLLLGLYDDAGRLDYVGFCSGMSAKDKKALTPRLEALVAPPGFDGARVPGGKSRWTKSERSTEWQPLKPELVIEVRYDHMTGGRFRHGTTLMRWRPDKAPRQCTWDQIGHAGELSPLAILH